MLTKVAKHNAAAVEESAAAIEEQAAAFQIITKSTEELAELSGNLNVLIKKFKLEE